MVINRSSKSPVFIIGLPRSGTKLVRALLNNHPDIFITNNETEILPYWMDRFSSYGDLSCEKNFSKLYSDSLSAPYFIFRQRENKPVVDMCAWYKSCPNYTVAGVFQGLVSLDVGVIIDQSNVGSMVWGDKSPGYLYHIDRIKRCFPEAKFIHVIRDVRDHCLSMKKAFGKSLVRSAHRWSEALSTAREQARSYPSDYLEIKYENILKDTERCCEQLCEFVHLEYYSGMTHQVNTREEYGDVQGKVTIDVNNHSKHMQHRCGRDIERIEQCSYTLLKELGYSICYATEEKKMGQYLGTYLFLYDGISLLKKDSQKYGLSRALRERYKIYSRTKTGKA